VISVKECLRPYRIEAGVTLPPAMPLGELKSLMAADSPFIKT